MSVKTDRFIEKIRQGCLSLWSLYGILPSVACAQAALESGWGTSQLAIDYNNLFGIKGSYNQATITLPTTEYYQGNEPIAIADSFRVYPNWNTSILDYGRLLSTNARYQSALYTVDYHEQIKKIVAGGYATDPFYVEKIIAIIEGYQLRQLDTLVLDKETEYFVIPDYSGYSIVDALEATGVENANMAFCAELALVNGIVRHKEDYFGTTEQNLTLLKLLKAGKLKKSI